MGPFLSPGSHSRLSLRVRSTDPGEGGLSLCHYTGGHGSISLIQCHW